MTEIDRRILAGRIKDLRLHAVETQREFAMRLGIRFEMMLNYETAVRQPDYDDTKKFQQEAIRIGKRDLAGYFEDRMKGLLQGARI